LPRITISHFML